jgi:hypothetical protein
MKNDVMVADRRDYVVSTVDAPISALSGSIQISVSLDTDYPWMWTGIQIGSIYSLTPDGGGGFVALQPSDVRIQILDSDRNFYFSDPLQCDTFQYSIAACNNVLGNNRNEIFVINPEQPQPAGGAFLVYVANTNATGALAMEIILTGYKVRMDCLKTGGAS